MLTTWLCAANERGVLNFLNLREGGKNQTSMRHYSKHKKMCQRNVFTVEKQTCISCYCFAEIERKGISSIAMYLLSKETRSHSISVLL